MLTDTFDNTDFERIRDKIDRNACLAEPTRTSDSMQVGLVIWLRRFAKRQWRVVVDDDCHLWDVNSWKNAKYIKRKFPQLLNYCSSGYTLRRCCCWPVTLTKNLERNSFNMHLDAKIKPLKMPLSWHFKAYGTVFYQIIIYKTFVHWLLFLP